MRQVTSTKKTVLPNRVTRWKAPTGRWLDPGKTFHLKGTRGEHVFIAYVEADPPYVECRKVGKGNIRCVDPARITAVHTGKPEEFED